MNLVAVTPNLTLSLCFQDLLIKFAPNYDLMVNEFRLRTNDQQNQSNSRHLDNMSVRELVDWVERLDINELFSLRVQISNKFKVRVAFSDIFCQ